MSLPLAIKYRPRRFETMIGQKLAAVVLQRMVDTDQVPTGILFSGPSGTGKTTAARILASGLDSADVIEVDAASNGGVADVRAMIESLRYSSGGAHRTVIYDEAHSLTRDAFNALLKTLEEPPAGTIFVLVTTEPQKIPATVLSRLTEFEFRSVTPSEILERLIAVSKIEKIEISIELLTQLAEASMGNVRIALTRLDQMSRAGIETIDQYTELVGDHDSAPALLKALMTGDAAVFFPVLEDQLSAAANPAQISAQLIECLRDIMILKAGGTPKATGQALQDRRDIALRLDTDRVLAGCKLLWDLKTLVRGSKVPRNDLELALMLMAEVFTRGQHQQPQPRASEPPVSVVATPATEHPPYRKMTLAEMRSGRDRTA